MESPRASRVGEQIHKEISAMLVKGIKDPRIGFVTITAVEVTRDLSIAKVFFTVVGDDTARKESEKGLKSSVPYIRREIGRRIRMRHVPEIRFQYDKSLEYGTRIESLIQEIHGQKNDDPSDSEEN
jgi:ribosome-binding factor A